MWKGEETQMRFRKGCVSKNIFRRKQPLTQNSPPLPQSLPYWFHQQRNGGKQQEWDWFLPSPSSFWAPLSFAPSSSPWTCLDTDPACRWQGQWQPHVQWPNLVTEGWIDEGDTSVGRGGRRGNGVLDWGMLGRSFSEGFKISAVTESHARSSPNPSIKREQRCKKAKRITALPLDKTEGEGEWESQNLSVFCAL